MQYILLCICIILILAIAIKIKISSMGFKEYGDDYSAYKKNKNYNENTNSQNGNNNIELTNKDSIEYWEKLRDDRVEQNLKRSEYLIKKIKEDEIKSNSFNKFISVFIVLIIFCIVLKTGSSLLINYNNSENKEMVENESVIKDPETVKKRFNDFFKEGEYIYIKRFQVEILGMVQDMWEVNEEWIDVIVYGDGYNTDFLSIKPKTKQSEIDEYIKRIGKKRNINYAYVHYNDDVLHMVELTENNLEYDKYNK